jgi:hypothetical protein
MDVTSSNYPRYDCNLNNGLQMYTAGDSLVAINNIYFNSLEASYLNLPVADSTTSIEENFSANGIPVEVYPNPASDEIEIFSGGVSVQLLQLLDISGKIITSVNEPGNHTGMDVRNLPAGIYFLKIYAQNSTSVRKIVVLKK